MKKKISLVLVLALLMSVMIPANIQVSAATVDQSSPAHLIKDFEDGVIGNSDSDSDYTTSLVDGAGASTKALKVTTSGTGAPSFTFGYRPGYTYNRSCYYDASGNAVDTAVYETVTVERKYEFSAWIKVDSAPTSDTVELVYTFENPEKDSYKDMSPTTVEKKITFSSAGLKAGEWVKVTGEFVTDQNETVTANFTYTKEHEIFGYVYKTETVSASNQCSIPETGKMKVVVGGGMSYTIDDFVIMTKGSVYSYSNTPDSDTSVTRESDRFYKPQTQVFGGVGNGLGLYSFANETSLTTTANANGWRVAYATATLNAANGETIDGVPNETLRGNYATLTTTSNDGQLICDDIDYRFGVQYYVYVWARAENETALNARLQAVVNLGSRTDKENIKNNFITTYASSILPEEENQSIYLTNEWRRYTFVFKSSGATYDEELANFSLKITNNGQTDAEGNAVSLTGAQYSLGNIKFYQQSGTTPSVLNATGTLKSYPLGGNNYNVELDSHVDGGNISNCLTRVMVPFNGDYVITKTLTNWKNEETFQMTADNITDVKMVVNPRDRSNHYGEEYVTFGTGLNNYGLTAVAEFDQEIWAYDMPKLTATVKYNAPEGNETLLALCAMYDSNNKMVGSDIQEFTLTKGEGEMALSIDTVYEAVKAKVFLWEAGTYAPRKDGVAELSIKDDAIFIYVDPENGKFEDVGINLGYDFPVKTIDEALAVAKNWLGTYDVCIVLMPGLHKVESTINIDSTFTTANTKLTITSYDKTNKGVISGGTDLTGKFTHYENGIYRAPVPVGTQSRQLYVDGVKGVRARSEGRLEGFTNTTVYGSDKYPVKDESGNRVYGVIKAEDTSYKDFKHVDDLEFVFYKLWTMARCGVDSITTNDDGTISFHMDSPGFENLSMRGNTGPNGPAWIENAYELIDQGGEWYLDEEGDGTNGYLYYLPRDGENINSVQVILPTFDNYSFADGPIIKVEGTADAPARNIEFNAVEISHTTWTRPSTVYGHSDAQNNHIRESIKADNITGDRLSDGAIDIKYADNIDFLNCDFTRMGNTALRLLDGSRNCDVIGNEFYYLSGGAVNIGDFKVGGYKTDITSDVPVADAAKIVKNINFTNNYIHHVAQDYWSASAISAGFPENVNIMHNEICNIPYSGMHIGYGHSSYKWSTLLIKIENNYIHDLFQGDIYDGGCIYTYGATSGSKTGEYSTMRGNYLENIGPGGATLYNDQGSTYWLVENNVSDIRDAWGETDPTTGVYKGASNCMNINLDNNGVTHALIWRNNYSPVNDTYLSTGTKNDTSCQLEEPKGVDLTTGTWNADARAIIANAGIQPEYRSNFEFGLQALLVPKAVRLSVGETFANSPCFITGKDTMYKNNALVVDVVSSNTAVATADATTITAVSAGTAVITYTVKEGNIYRSVSTIVTVE